MNVDCNERFEDFRGIFKLSQVSAVNDGLPFVKTTFNHLLGRAWSELAQRHSEPCTVRMNKNKYHKRYNSDLTYSYGFTEERGKIRINSGKFSNSLSATNHKRHRQSNEPVTVKSEYM